MNEDNKLREKTNQQLKYINENEIMSKLKKYKKKNALKMIS